MAKITVFRAKSWDVANDAPQTSRRWFTREGAEAWNLVVIEGSAIEIDDSSLEPGEQWTRRGFDPDATSGLQTQVR